MTKAPNGSGKSSHVKGILIVVVLAVGFVYVGVTTLQQVFKIMQSNYQKSEKRNKYQPALSDEQIEQKLRELPGVTDVKLVYTDTFEDGQRYYVGLTYAEDATARQASDNADKAVALSRQGKPVGVTTVDTFMKGKSIGQRSLGVPTLNVEQRERYGSQPGTGMVPESSPKPQLTPSGRAFFEENGIPLGE